MMTHGKLKDEETRRLVNVFIRLINQHTETVNMQNINFYFNPEKYQPVHQQSDLQIFYGKNREMDVPNYIFSVFNSKNESNESERDPNKTAAREEKKLHFYHRYENGIGDTQRNIALKRLYGENILPEQFFVGPETVGDDNGKDCDCNAIMCLAYAITYILDKNPETTRFKMSSNDRHGTMFIRMKLFEMFHDQKLYPFKE